MYLFILTLGKLSNFQSVQKVDQNFEYSLEIKVNKEKKHEKSLKIRVLCKNEKKNSTQNKSKSLKHDQKRCNR